MNIIIGHKYNLIGNVHRSPGCNCSCRNCFSSGIIVTKILENEEDSDTAAWEEGRIICGKSLKKEGICAFHPDDLEPIKIKKWKELIQQ